ncbi:putative mediator of RNA polymerase II transcription subunit 26a [Datura stramonium]|uniref:Mediator of RNA polymerase II transcription subunit 26a n=1 Tax=Datura stramonium TaxID=4076 RepID=A0ABS8TL13_DATST|nr:putative mediator of RNA polymerase II transcription subunit 26a [Datura stramonium]
MNRISVKLNKWREYFRSANSDIFDIIEYAVMVAAVDHPKEFQLKRDRIAELLFTCKVTRGFDCDKIELAVPNADDVVPNAVDVDVDVDKGTRKCINEFVREFEARKEDSSN